MGEVIVRSIAELERRLRRDMAAREKRVLTALRKSARAARNFIVREKVPRAFGELADAAQIIESVTGAAVSFEAPHAAAVEVGSRPHTPPIEPLIAWVTLRGLQGLSPGGRVRANPKANPRREAARVIAGALHPRLGGNKGAATWRSHAQNAFRALTPKTLGSLDADPAVRSIAYAIQRKISQRGTKAFRYVGSSITEAVSLLDHFVKQALPDT